MNTPPPGRLIGASLGPGDPGLITRRAWAALQSGARWLYPVKKAEASSYALGIVQRGGLAVPDDAEALIFPMTRDPVALAKAWARAASRTLALLQEGRDLVFLVEGDASTFSTFGHLARVVRELAPEVVVETIPGVSAFAAAAATTGTPLAEEDETFAVIPAAYGVEVIDRLLDEFDTLVLLKVKPLARRGARTAGPARSACHQLLHREGRRAGRTRRSRRGHPRRREGQLPLAAARPEPQAGARRAAPGLPQTPCSRPQLTPNRTQRPA
jgi:precorrin-2/cobalt-factor-2 C20-methyltransferase